MSEASKLNKPWLVAVWPGMGHVALSAGYYLMAKLGMHMTRRNLTSRQRKKDLARRMRTESRNYFSRPHRIARKHMN